MPAAVHRKAHHHQQRPQFECIALLLQGGGALGAYQAGVYEALAEARIHPDWVAGISIGAINSAIIAGNTPDKRVEKLRQFYDTFYWPNNATVSVVGDVEPAAALVGDDFRSLNADQRRAVAELAHLLGMFGGNELAVGEHLEIAVRMSSEDVEQLRVKEGLAA